MLDRKANKRTGANEICLQWILFLQLAQFGMLKTELKVVHLITSISIR